MTRNRALEFAANTNGHCFRRLRLTSGLCRGLNRLQVEIYRDIVPDVEPSARERMTPGDAIVPALDGRLCCDHDAGVAAAIFDLARRCKRILNLPCPDHK